MSRQKAAKYTAPMTPEQRRIFGRLITLPETYGAAAIREQFHCSRATAEVVATAIADYRMTPAERKAKAAAAPKPQRHFKPVTIPGGGTDPAFANADREHDLMFSDAANKQRAEMFRCNPHAKGARWSRELGKWIAIENW